MAADREEPGGRVWLPAAEGRRRETDGARENNILMHPAQEERNAEDCVGD